MEFDPRLAMFDDLSAEDAGEPGPGDHTDEASAALGALRDVLDGTDWRTLDQAAAVPHDAVRLNPAEDPYSDAILPRGNLFPQMRLLTGMWGPSGFAAPEILRDFDYPAAGGSGRVRLPLARENPGSYEPRLAADFATRLTGLQEEFLRCRKIAQANYKDAGTEIKKRTWVIQLDRLRDAVAFVQRQLATPAPSIIDAKTQYVFGLPFRAGAGWQPIMKGNKKLAFVAYSELPMATCPGAGECGLPFDKFERQAATGKLVGGWCYSFRAFRSAHAYARMFLSTLAQYADREFAIRRAGGGHLPETDAVGRAAAGVRGLPFRVWPKIVAQCVLALTARARGAKPQLKRNRGRAPTRVFWRLFVDGDIGTTDNLLAWMDAVARVGPVGQMLEPGAKHVECYGYSKAWQEFAEADRLLGGRWPINYVLNLSSGSVYAKKAAYAGVRQVVENLPIARGYFEAVPIRAYLPQLETQLALLRRDPRAAIPLPPPSETPFAFDQERVRAFVQLHGAQTPQEVEALIPGAVQWPLDEQGRQARLAPADVRRLAYEAYLERLVFDPQFGALVRRELRRDDDNEASLLDAYEAGQRARLEALIRVPGPRVRRVGRVTHVLGEDPDTDGFTLKQLTDKALALALHETLWTFGLGGSCPLVCGNCSDHPADSLLGGESKTSSSAMLGVHRCASRGALWHKTIHIGLH